MNMRDINSAYRREGQGPDTTIGSLSNLSRKKTPATSKNKNRKSEKISAEDLNKAVEGIKKELEARQTRIEIQFDQTEREPIVKFVDKKTGKILRQLPPDEVIKIRKAFRQEARGILMDTKI